MTHGASADSTQPPVRQRPLPIGPQQTEAHAYRVEPLVEGLDVPWAIAFLPDGRMLVTERNGSLLIREKDSARLTPVAGVPKVITGDEAGLFDVALDPDYSRTGWIYLSFSDVGADETSMTRIVRGRLRDGQLVDQQTIFAAPAEFYSASRTAYGARLLFDGDYLFFSVGDRNSRDRAQDLGFPNGKVHRIFRDGRIPPDNPFVGVPGALGSIWTLGHRNPQGLARDPVTGTLWESEHGPRGGDELNLLQRGQNYGWPVITHGINYDGTRVSEHTEREGMQQPIVHWTPSIAVSVLMFYTGDRFPRWKNSLFIGSLGHEKLLRMEPGRDAGRQELIVQNIGRIRDIETGPDGLIYLSLEAPGRIVRLVPE